MITKEELLGYLLNNKDFEDASAILKSHNTQFTIYSCNDKNIGLVMSGDKKIIDYIKRANNEKKDIEIIIREETTVTKTQEMVVNEFFDYAVNEMSSERLFILMGETGVGKSTVLEERLNKLENSVLYTGNESIDPYQLCFFLADKDGKGLKPYKTPFLDRVEKGGVVGLDELNLFPRDTLMLIQGLTDDKKTIVIGDEIVHIHPKFKIIATMNPPSETDERKPLGDALLGRAVGCVMELTDKIICSRLNIKQQWLDNVRTLYAHIRNTGLIDLRDLDFRDYKKMSKFDFEEQLKFKVCQGDVSNIAEFRKIKETGEYKKLLTEIGASK